MKVQCSCGSKYEFEITSEMSARPIKFVCPACGLDASEFVDGLIRNELGQAGTPHGVPVPIQVGPRAVRATSAPAIRVAKPPPPQRARPAAVRLQSPPPPAAEPVAAEAAPAGKPCLKHPGEAAVEKCYICSKPICPKCMELFGYVCSPLCKAKAESHGIDVPVYAGQKSVVEARLWRKVVWVSTGVGAVLVALLGFWFWYAWFGCLPRPVFSVRFPTPAYSGQAVTCGTDKDQIVFLHGGTLARYEMKTRKEVWSLDLIDKKQIQADIAKVVENTRKAIDRANNESPDFVPKMPDVEKLAKQMERDRAEELGLHVRGQNIWISEPRKLVRYDWDTGKPTKEVAIQSGFGGLIARGDELLTIDREGSNPVITKINLDTGESSTQPLGGPEAQTLATQSNVIGGPIAGTQRKQEGAGLPIGMPGKDMNKPMDPAKVAEQANRLSLPATIALPALIGNSMNQERTLAAMDDQTRPKSGADWTGPASSLTLIPTKDSFVQFGARLIERRVETREAMKPPPAKSALDGNVTAGKSLEVASEMLNEMQRSRGGSTIEEDVSRYQVTVRTPGVADAWTGEVIGPPQLFPLQTVNVLAANKMILVLDKSNCRMWQAPLTYNVRGEIQSLDPGTALYGQAPCVEHKGSLYVIDQGVLTAFDLATGNVRWRFPSIGIAGIFFDDHDMMYVNTTTASPDTIKYSRQIDLSDKAVSVVLKLNPENGRELWSAQPGGLVSYVSGKIILVVQYFMPLEEDDNPYRVETGFEKLPHLRIRRLNASNGHEVWEYFQQRAPLDIAFDQNTIRIVFKKEVQVLKFLTL